MRRLAEEYGLSDVGLAKVCRRHKIPRPGIGYWAKKEFGKAPRRTPLPKCSEQSLQSITLRVVHYQSWAEIEAQFGDEIKELLGRARALPEIKVPASLRRPHVLVEATRKSYLHAKKASEYEYGCSRNNKEEILDLSVTHRNVPRALRFFNSLIRAIEKTGGSVESTRHGWRQDARTTVTLCGEKAASIRVRELLRRQDSEPGSYQKYDYVPTGQLVLDHGPSSYESPHCKDGKTAKIEDKINGTIIWWARKLGWERLQRRKREEEERVQRERELERKRVREDFERRQREERERVDKLLADVSGSHQSRIIRDYVEVVRQQALGNGGIEEGSDLERWIAWARQQADRLDPLTPSPPSILDEESPE